MPGSLEPLSWAAVGHLPDFKLEQDRTEQREEVADPRSLLVPQILSASLPRGEGGGVWPLSTGHTGPSRTCSPLN